MMYYTAYGNGVGYFLDAFETGTSEVLRLDKINGGSCHTQHIDSTNSPDMFPQTEDKSSCNNMPLDSKQNVFDWCDC